MKMCTSCDGIEVVTISEIYYLGYFQVKYNINNISEAFFMIEVLTYIFHVWNFHKCWVSINYTQQCSKEN